MKIRILGIDPGSQVTGYGIIDSEGNHSTHIDNGVIRLEGKAVTEKLRLIYQGVADLIQRFQPDEVSIERVFVHRNADSALKLGQARGAAITSAAIHDIVVFEYTANQVKQAVVGKGHAAKKQVQHMVKVLLNLREIPSTDASDALANAICHAHSREGMSKIKGVTGIRQGRLR